MHKTAEQLEAEQEKRNADVRAGQQQVLACFSCCAAAACCSCCLLLPGACCCCCWQCGGSGSGGSATVRPACAHAPAGGRAGAEAQAHQRGRAHQDLQHMQQQCGSGQRRLPHVPHGAWARAVPRCCMLRASAGRSMPRAPPSMPRAPPSCAAQIRKAEQERQKRLDIQYNKEQELKEFEVRGAAARPVAASSVARLCAVCPRLHTGAQAHSAACLPAAHHNNRKRGRSGRRRPRRAPPRRGQSGRKRRTRARRPRPQGQEEQEQGRAPRQGQVARRRAAARRMRRRPLPCRLGWTEAHLQTANQLVTTEHT